MNITGVLSVTLLFIVGVLSKYEILERNYHDIDQVSTIFDKFTEKFEKKYSPYEYSYRLEVFKENLIKMNKWNEENPEMFGINYFADLKYEELSMGSHIDIGNLKSTETYNEDGVSDVPDHMDWRSLGIVSPVKSQFRCQCCYAFSAVGHLESMYAKKYGVKPPILSEQQILDCDGFDFACSGGYPHKVFRYISDEGIMLADDYPYEARQGDCMFDKEKSVLKVNETKLLTFKDEEQLKSIVAKEGPVSIALFATEKMLRLKTSKVVKPLDIDCNFEGVLNHAVLLVGYGRDNDDDYWIIKNSWGSHWADRGYMRLARGMQACNIGIYTAFATIQNNF